MNIRVLPPPTQPRPEPALGFKPNIKKDSWERRRKIKTKVLKSDKLQELLMISDGHIWSCDHKVVIPQAVANISFVTNKYPNIFVSNF